MVTTSLLTLWGKVFGSVLFPIFEQNQQAIDHPSGDDSSECGVNGYEVDEESLLYETCTLSLQLAVDLFVNFCATVNPLLKKVLALFMNFVKRVLFDDDKWAEVVLSIKEAADETFPDLTFISNKDSSFVNHEDSLTQESDEESSESTKQGEDLEKQMRDRFSSVRFRAVIQLLLIHVTISCFLLGVLLALL
ncbi:hypothetical protein Tco_0775202 [Tanacetum coccineum]